MVGLWVAPVNWGRWAGTSGAAEEGDSSSRGEGPLGVGGSGEGLRVGVDLSPPFPPSPPQVWQKAGIKHCVWMGPKELPGVAILSPHWEWSVGRGACSEWMVSGEHRKSHFEGE